MGRALTAALFRLDPLPAGELVQLGGAEGRHASTVRRMRPGEPVTVVDGHGAAADCVVETAERDALSLRVLTRRTVPPPAPRLVAVQALVKGERSELAVDLLTEVGVDEIVPWQAARCVARWSGERSERRWQAAIEAAAKQSRRVWWPTLAPVAETPAVARRLSSAAIAVVLDENATASLADLPLPSAGEVAFVVGPEGGITDDELAAFDAAGASRVRLGPTVLRAASAGVVAASVLLAGTRWSESGNSDRR